MVHLAELWVPTGMSLDHPRWPSAALVACACLASGCVGSIGSDSAQQASAGSGGGASDAGDSNDSGDGGSVSGPTAGGSGSGGSGSGGNVGTGGSCSGTDGMVLGEFTRLTRTEYSATIQEALGITPDVHLVPEDGRVGHFTSNVEVTPDPIHPYLLAAEELAQVLIPAELPACEASDADTCLTDNYAPLLARLYRRPFGATDSATLSKVIQDVAADGGSAVDATRTMLAASLLSPDFLYRAQASHSDASASLRRLAERVSFVLWDAPPDAELSEALDGANATQAAGLLAAQSQRLSRDSRATPIIARFLGQWLDVDTDLRLEDPDFETSPEYLELLALVDNALQNDVPARDFIRSNTGFVHPQSAETYALDDVGSGDEVVQVQWPPSSNRRGLIGQELFAGSTRHPDHSRREIFRGLLVRRALLCDEIRAPDADLVALAGEVGDRTEDARCRNCHRLIDPIGRAFSVLDQDTSEPAPPPEVLVHDELEGSYDDLGHLLDRVATSRAFAECFAKNWLGFFLEQPLGSVDQNWVAQLADSIEQEASLPQLIEETVTELALRSENVTPWCEGE